ncbi:uncharacterized protein LOC123667741 [Melitaea cinxia]|uniref:uncharacterized protein LOC123667741 n=1 Tax=Melitaea cinxia TaxID=113334 RepID=UPI001E273147|nr:uncharacterized protein LOC123667741 [Melitaea cinxia]
MSVFNLWVNEIKEPKLKTCLSYDDRFKSPTKTSRSSSPQSRVGEAILNNYIELINSKSNLSADPRQTEALDKPFDFCDDEEFAFGINLLNNNVACVGDNITKLIQMAQEPWPDNVKLFQPYEVEQILLPDNASCLAVQAFLKMCSLPFEVEMRWNAEFMSPSGRVPFIKCGAFVVSELEPIVHFAANKGVTLCSNLSTEERAEMRAYMSLITNVLVNAELYISWVDQETFNTVTRVRNSSVYPWPLGWFQTRSKRSSVIKRLKALHWYDKTLEQVLADVEQCCNSLSQRLGDRDYFFGTPTPLDALLYGHMKALLSANGPKAVLMIKPITNALLRHFLRMSNITQMKLTPQEEYLVTQGCQLCVKRRMSPVRSLSQVRRSKVCIKNRESEKCGKDVFGFKPFASKQIIIMTSRDGKITCEYNTNRNITKSTLNESNQFIIDIMDDIITKVDEIADNKYTDIVKNEFEVIAFPNKNFASFENKVNDLDTINESGTDMTVSDLTEEVIKVIDSVVDDAFIDNGVIDVITKNSSELFMDSSPTELDALVFGHVFTIITTRLPCRKLADTVRRHDTLVALAKRIDEQYFKRP